MKKCRTFILSEEQIQHIIGEEWNETEGTADEVTSDDGSIHVYASDKPSSGLPEPLITNKLKMTNDMGMLWKNGGVTFSAVKESCKKKDLTEASQFINNGNKTVNFSDDQRQTLANEREGSLAKQASAGGISPEKLVYTLSRRNIKLKNGDVAGANKIASDASAKILSDKYEELKKQEKSYINSKPEGQKLNVTKRDGSKGGAHSLKPNVNGITKIEA